MPTNYEDQLARAVAELLDREPGEVDVTDRNLLAEAGRIAVEHHNIRHRDLHGLTQRGGAVVWGLRNRGLTWRQIYDLTGIVQRTGARWQRLFEAEGIDPRPAPELDARWQGLDKS